jgi:hypothetical protein
MITLRSFVPVLSRGVPYLPMQARPPGAVVPSEQPETLEQLACSKAEIAVWRRSVPVEIAAELDGWARSGPPPVDRACRWPAADLGPWMPGLREGATRSWLDADLRSLIDRFTLAFDLAEVRLVLGVVAHDRCRKFHMDNLRMRMVCTYVGPGTEWVADPGHVEQARAGDVPWIRGNRWGAGTFGGVHRSPPIAGSGRVRLVLAVSTMDR